MIAITLLPVISPLADTLPVTLKPDNSKPISKVPADNNVVAIIVSAVMVLFVLIELVVVLPLSVTICKVSVSPELDKRLVIFSSL